MNWNISSLKALLKAALPFPMCAANYSNSSWIFRFFLKISCFLPKNDARGLAVTGF